MSEISLNQFLEEIDSWLEECGVPDVGKNGRKFQRIDKHRRKELFIVLLEKLRTMGADKSFFTTDRKQRIVAVCIGPKKEIGSAYQGIKEWIEADLRKAIAAVFGSDTELLKSGKKVAETVASDPVASDEFEPLIDPEMEEFLRRRDE